MNLFFEQWKLRKFNGVGNYICLSDFMVMMDVIGSEDS